MDPQLLLFNIGSVTFILVVAVLGIVVLIKNKTNPINVTFFLSSLAVVTIQSTHLFGFNVASSLLSQKILMFSLSGLYVIVFTTHFTFALLDQLKEKKNVLIFLYIVSTILSVFFVMNPERLLLVSTPKLYFPNYYNIGNLHWLFLVYFLSVVVYFFYHLISTYFQTKDERLKNKIKYVLMGLVVSYTAGPFAFLLAYNLSWNPLIAVFTGFYSIPFAYAILKYDLIDIKIVAKKAVMYGLLVGAISLIIGLSGNVVDFVQIYIPGIPNYAFPTFMGLISVILGSFVWTKLREVDQLKYEFITVILHKFRTPLTHIKWSANELMNSSDTRDKEMAYDDIVVSNDKLLELTDTLVGLSDSDTGIRLLSTERINAVDFIKTISSKYEERYHKKKLSLIVSGDTNVSIGIDKAKFSFAVRTLIENALLYTENGGHIEVVVSSTDKHVLISVSDSGIGIAKDQLPHIFEKFYRSREAKLANTEGLGIGLYLSKRIIEQHGGKLYASSRGVGYGSNLTIMLPKI